MRLIDTKTNLEIKEGDVVTTFRGERYILVSFYGKPAPSTGRVVLREGKGGPHVEYYPNVINARIEA